MGAAQFHLFHPSATVTGTTLTCAVDVVPADDLLLDRGDTELVADFAATLGLDTVKVTDWSLVPFNTPYYAIDIDSDVFEQSMSPAWRLRFAATVPAGTTAPTWAGDPGPHGSDAVDRGWWAHRTPWDWSAHETVVISCDGPEPDLAFLSDLALPHTTETMTLHGETRTVGMVRVSLDAIRLPDQFDDVWDVVEACHRQAFLVHHVLAYGLFLDVID
jgi:hypothetical protein